MDAPHTLELTQTLSPTEENKCNYGIRLISLTEEVGFKKQTENDGVMLRFHKKNKKTLS